MNFVSNLFRKVVDKEQSTSKAQNTTVEIQKDLKTNLHVPPKLNRSYEGPDKENSLSQSNLNRTYDGSEFLKSPTENIPITQKAPQNRTFDKSSSLDESNLNETEKYSHSLNSTFEAKSQPVKLTFDFEKNDFVESDNCDGSISEHQFHLNDTFETETNKGANVSDLDDSLEETLTEEKNVIDEGNAEENVNVSNTSDVQMEIDDGICFTQPPIPVLMESMDFEEAMEVDDSIDHTSGCGIYDANLSVTNTSPIVLPTVEYVQQQNLDTPKSGHVKSRPSVVNKFDPLTDVSISSTFEDSFLHQLQPEKSNVMVDSLEETVIENIKEDINEDCFFKPASIDIFSHPIKTPPGFKPPRESVLQTFDPLANINITNSQPSDSFAEQLTSFKNVGSDKIPDIMIDSLEVSNIEIQDTAVKLSEILEEQIKPVTPEKAPVVNFEEIPITVKTPQNFDDIPITVKTPPKFHDVPISVKTPQKFDDIPISVKTPQNFDDIPISVKMPNIDSFSEATEPEIIPEIKPNLNLTTEPEKSDLDDIESDLPQENIPITQNLDCIQTNFDDIPIKPSKPETEGIDCPTNFDEIPIKPNENLPANISIIKENEQIDCTINFDDIPIKPSQNLSETEGINCTKNFDDIPIKPNENLPENISIIKEKEQIDCTMNFDDIPIKPIENPPENVIMNEKEEIGCTTNFDDISIKPNKNPPEDTPIIEKEQIDSTANFDDFPIKTSQNSFENILRNEEQINSTTNFDDVPIKPLPEDIPIRNENRFDTEEIKSDFTLNFDDIPIKPNENLPDLQELCTGSHEQIKENVSNFDNVPSGASNLNVTLNFDDIPMKPRNFATDLMQDDHILEKINSEKDQIEKFINISYSAKSNLDETNELDVIDSRAEVNQIQSELRSSDDSGSTQNESSCEEKSLNKTKINDFTDSQIECLKLKTVIDDLKEEIELYQKKIKLLQTDLSKSKERENELEKSVEERKRISKSENTAEEIVSLHSTISDREKENLELRLNVAQLTKMYQAVQESMRKSLEVNEQIKKDRDMAQMHLTNVEAAFSDVHQKYEGCKVQIQQLRMSDDRLRRDIAANVDTIETQSKKYDSLKIFAMGQIEKCNEEVKEMKAKYESEIAKLTAQMRRYEIKSRSLEQTLQQKTKECEQLAAIYDEMVGKV